MISINITQHTEREYFKPWRSGTSGVRASQAGKNLETKTGDPVIGGPNSPFRKLKLTWLKGPWRREERTGICQMGTATVTETGIWPRISITGNWNWDKIGMGQLDLNNIYSGKMEFVSPSFPARRSRPKLRRDRWVKFCLKVKNARDQVRHVRLVFILHSAYWMI